MIVNWAGASIISSTFERSVFFAGVALRSLEGEKLLVNILDLRDDLRDRYGNSASQCVADANLAKLFRDSLKALTKDGIAIVCSMTSTAPAEIQRTKCEERGHVVQFGIETNARSSSRGIGWYEDLFARREARLFVEGLKRQGNTLYDTDCRVSIVNEFAMKINDGKWREYDITPDAARGWITAYFCGVRQNLGEHSLLKFLPVLRGRVAKAGFRDATE